MNAIIARQNARKLFVIPCELPPDSQIMHQEKVFCRRIGSF